MNRNWMAAGCVAIAVLNPFPGVAAEPEPTWAVDLSDKQKPRTNIADLGFAPDGRTLLVLTVSSKGTPDEWCLDSLLRGFDVLGKKELFQFDHTTPSEFDFIMTTRFAFLPDNRMLTAFDGSLAIRNCRDGKADITRTGSAHEVIGVCVTADGKGFFLLTGSDKREQSLVCGTLPTGNRMDPEVWKEFRSKRLFPPKTDSKRPCPAAVSPDGTRFAVYDESELWRDKEFLTLYEIKASELLELTSLAKVKSPEGGVSRLQFSPDSHLLATGGWDGKLRLWETAKPTQTWKERATVAGGNMMVTTVAFRADGRVVAFGTVDEKKPNVWLVDVRTGSLITSFRAGGADGKVRVLAFSPDGKSLATGTWMTGRLEVWDAEKLLGRR